MKTQIHIFALPDLDGVRHTHLTRLEGAAPDLPPLAEWLGAEDLDINRIELFPVADLGDMPLSVYLASAFDPEPEPLEASAPYLDAVKGTALIVPDEALSGTPMPGGALERITTLPLIQPDHSADLPKAEVNARPDRPASSPAPQAGPPGRAKRLGRITVLAAAVALVIVLLRQLT